MAATNEQRLQLVEEAVQLLEQQIRGLSTLSTRDNGLESTLQTTQDSSHIATTIDQRLEQPPAPPANGSPVALPQLAPPPSINQPRLNLYVFLNAADLIKVEWQGNPFAVYVLYEETPRNSIS
ncbi:hypothetical protein TorRG33x02_257520 [Trema orientale]|uniref:Uncharacterized protein n=1 Tax=Trema orientale TaxID=63057 RepID=A0A2P5DA97_TREOI|nr:hypothetical protein TorRG33x02_257520 [Trema orientale]